ncbi:MAG TPA: CRISPR-associated protein Cas4 [Tepidisphaeraceae bacterium]|jgi:CRISPR-associated exonuclease Cas4
MSDDELLPISALQHVLFCPRQCALIHNEQLWAENVQTIEGKHLHEKADRGRGESRPGVRIARGLMLRSHAHRLIGKADVVEFLVGGAVVPVEYKRGKPKVHDADRVQLCAQALCLEEMLSLAIPAGALFYGQTRRRLDVPIDASLRQVTIGLIGELQSLLDTRRTPPAVYESAKCDRCSLIDLCLPKAKASASAYIARQLSAVEAADDPFDDTEEP